MVIKLTISYDGTNYYGFQKQYNLDTIELKLEEAIKKITKEDIKIQASGRTDRFVHAIGQVVSFETNLSLKNNNWKKALNTYLPNDIRVIKVEQLLNFHARYDAISKEYHYYISLNEYDLFKRNYLVFENNLNINKIRKAIKYLNGTHDFKSFSKQDKDKKDKNTIKTLKLKLRIKKEENILEFIFISDGFLKYMVRSIMGVLIKIGQNKLEPEIINEIFKEDKRKNYMKTANPQGLYLYKVNYKKTLK